MNVTELARKLRLPAKELLEILPVIGFDVGKRAIKIDDRSAHKIVQDWPRLLAQYQESIKGPEVEIQSGSAIEERQIKTISIPTVVSVKDFSIKLNLPLSKVMAELMKSGVLASMNERIDFDTASIVGQDLGFEIIQEDVNEQSADSQSNEQIVDLLDQGDATDLKPRPPVVVVMGHVDHGKTKLLDTIRTTNVIDKESGGITQHIGAYQVVKKDKLITFIDTPGHEAFSTMRSRGARIADIAILVIAADDSIQPQTKESIKIIKSAGLPMIVAINKIDKPDANPDRVKQDLAAMNLMPEEWGGKTICVPISAKSAIGIDDLLEMILLVAETEKEKIMANPDAPAAGTIIESHIDKGEGPVATILVQRGTLKPGDLIMVADNFYGKIRAMKDFKGDDISQATPSTPVKIVGLKAAPSIGDILQTSEQIERKSKIKKYQLTEQATAYSKPFEGKTDDHGSNSLNIILKADVLGSLEAIIASLLQIEHPEVSVNIIAKGLGNINESDVQAAEAGKAIILSFHVKPTKEAQSLAQEKKVEIRIYDVIYKLLEEIRAELEKLLSPEVIKTELGRLKVLAVFQKQKDSIIAGGKITKGKALAYSKADVFRGDRKITTGNIVQLQIGKVDVNEVKQGDECGLKFSGKPVVEPGDILELYTEEIKEKKIK